MSTHDKPPHAGEDQFGPMCAVLARPQPVLPPLIAPNVVPHPKARPRVFPRGHRRLDPHRWFLHRAYTNLAVTFLGACVVVLRLRWMFIERSPIDHGFDVPRMAEDLFWFEADFHFWMGLAVMGLFLARMAKDFLVHRSDLVAERSRRDGALEFSPEWGAAFTARSTAPDRRPPRE